MSGSVYPGGIDSFTNPTAANSMSDVTVPHDKQHANANDAIAAIEATLGVNPQGSSSSVGALLASLPSTYLAQANTNAAIDAHLGGDATTVVPDVTALKTSRAVSGILTPATVSHADVQAALTAAAPFGARVQVAGAYSTTNTLTITGDCDLTELTITYTGTGTAVMVGTSTGTLFRAQIKAPRVINGSKTANGWAQTGVAGTVGVDVVNCYACRIDVPYVSGFATGLQLRGANSNGTQQTTIDLGHLDNNQVNLRFTGDSTGWANQDYFNGGRCTHNSNEGVQVAGTRHVVFANLPNPVNGHAFFGTSLESPNVVEYHIEAANAQWNNFYGSRFENTGGDANRRILSSGTSKNNMLVGGAYVANVTQVVEAPALPFDINSSELTTRRGGSATVPTMVLENVVASSGLIVALMASGAGAAGTNPQTGYTWGLTSQQIQGKRSADTYNRCIFDGLNGRLWLGDGTAAPVSYLMGTGAFFLFGGATTVGPLSDGAASLGTATNYRFAYIRAKTAVVTGADVTGNRPTPSAAGVGAMFYDTTLGKPIWSTGSAWHDATGATV